MFDHLPGLAISSQTYIFPYISLLVSSLTVPAGSDYLTLRIHFLYHSSIHSVHTCSPHTFCTLVHHSFIHTYHAYISTYISYVDFYRAHFRNPQKLFMYVYFLKPLYSALLSESLICLRFDVQRLPRNRRFVKNF